MSNTNSNSEKEINEFANLTAQTIKVKGSKSYKDHYGKALSGINQTLRAAEYDERHPEKRNLSITEKSILEGQERARIAAEKKETKSEPVRMTKEYVDYICKQRGIGCYDPNYVPSKTGLKSI